MLCCKLAKSSFGVHFENPFKRNIRLQQDKKDRKFSVNIKIFLLVWTTVEIVAICCPKPCVLIIVQKWYLFFLLVLRNRTSKLVFCYYIKKTNKICCWKKQKNLEIATTRKCAAIKFMWTMMTMKGNRDLTFFNNLRVKLARKVG